MRKDPRTSLLALLTAILMFVAPAVPAVASDNETEEPNEEGGDGRDGNNDQEEERGEDGRDGDDEDENEDDEGDEDKRKVEVSTDEDGIEIKLERESAAQEDKIEMSFDFEDAEFEVKFEAEVGDNETEMKLEAQFQAVAEYRDANGNGRFDSGEPIVSFWMLSTDGGDEPEGAGEPAGTVDWQTPSVSDATVGNLTGKKITAPARLGPNGTFELRFFVFGDFVDLANSSLKPTSVKIDIEIRNYPFEANDTALALFLKTKAKTEVEVEHDHEDLEDDEVGVAASSTLGGEPVSLVFAWKDSATVDGAPMPVATTTLRSKTETEQDEGKLESKKTDEFALSYARGAVIIHDPEAFVSIEPARAGIPGWTLGATLVALVASLVLVGRLRRRAGP